MTIITYTEAVEVTTLEQVKDWMTTNSISITGAISLSIDEMGFVKGFDTVETLTAPQIADFITTFFHKRSYGSKGADVASAGTITLTQGNFFDITGTTTIDFITTTLWKQGTPITLQFDSAVTINHDTGSVPANTGALFLDGSVNIAFTAGSTLTVVYDGTYWRETGRMVA